MKETEALSTHCSFKTIVLEKRSTLTWQVFKSLAISGQSGKFSKVWPFLANLAISGKFQITSKFRVAGEYMRRTVSRRLNFEKVLSFRSQLRSRLRRCRVSAQSEHFEFSCSMCASGRGTVMTSEFRKTNTATTSADVETKLVQIFSAIGAPLFFT